jgi:hypothetical protein
MNVFFFLACIALPFAAFWLLATSRIADRHNTGVILGVGIVISAGGLLCWGLYGVMLFQHPAWPWSADASRLSDFSRVEGAWAITRGEAAFTVTWLGFLGAAGLAALAPFAFTLDVLGWLWRVWALGAPLFLLISCAPACVVLLRAWRRSLLTRETR